MTDCITKARIKEVARIDLSPIRLPSTQPRIYDTADEARGGSFIRAEAMRGQGAGKDAACLQPAGEKEFALTVYSYEASEDPLSCDFVQTA